MRNPLSPGEGTQSLGRILASILGFQDSWIQPFLIAIGYVVTAGASGIRLYLRKKQGTAVFGFAWIYLFFHLGIISLFYMNWNLTPVQNKLPLPGFWEQVSSDKPMLIYIGGVILLLVFYLFRDFLPSREGMEKNPDYLGFGILSFLAKNQYQKELYTNLADPIIGFIIGYYLYESNHPNNLGGWVIICSICLLIESLTHLAQDWQIRKNKIVADALAQEHSGQNQHSKNQNDGRYPQF